SFIPQRVRIGTLSNADEESGEYKACLSVLWCAIRTVIPIQATVGGNTPAVIRVSGPIFGHAVRVAICFAQVQPQQKRVVWVLKSFEPSSRTHLVAIERERSTSGTSHIRA